MPNYYRCPDCGDYLDFNERFSHQCEKIESETVKQPEKEEKKPYDPQEAAETRERVLAKIRKLAV